MKTYRFTIKPLSAFGTPLMGDTLFGQLCWAVVHKFGEPRLQALLQGYHTQQPFMVVSDALPQGHIPLPILPSSYWEKGTEMDRKKMKKKQWVNLSDTQQAVSLWQQFAKNENEVGKKQVQDQPHNTLNRETHTTGKGEFTPYSMSQIWYPSDTLLDLYIVIDENKICASEIKDLLEQIGKFGYGRDASIGLGKFKVNEPELFAFSSTHANAYLTLANCAPQNLDLDKTRSFYQITTKFGRHSDIRALSQSPFKKPIILTKTGAVFTPQKFPETASLFLGNGLTNISHSQTNAIHQGYAPALPIALDFKRIE